MPKVGFAPAWDNPQLLLAHLGVPIWRRRATGHASYSNHESRWKPCSLPAPALG